MTSTADGEEGFLRRLIDLTGGPEHSLLGDDAAVLESFSPPLLYAVDTMQRGVHYDDSFTPRQAGHKLAGINLSDIAAMGGRPRWALLTLASDSDHETLEAWVEGVLEPLRDRSVRLVGGDVTAPADGSAENASLALLGRASREGTLRRRDARPGDRVAVSGPLGGPAAILRQDPGTRRAEEHRLLWDVPDRLDLARELVRGGIRCGIDLSDGLVKDLRRVCLASEVGARLNPDRIPLHEALKERDLPRQRSLRLALGGGDDYELLVAVPPSHEPTLPDGMIVIGEFTEDPGLDFDPDLPFPRESLSEGFDHFQGETPEDVD